MEEGTPAPPEADGPSTATVSTPVGRPGGRSTVDALQVEPALAARVAAIQAAKPDVMTASRAQSFAFAEEDNEKRVAKKNAKALARLGPESASAQGGSPLDETAPHTATANEAHALGSSTWSSKPRDPQALTGLGFSSIEDARSTPIEVLQAMQARLASSCDEALVYDVPGRARPPVGTSTGAGTLSTGAGTSSGGFVPRRRQQPKGNDTAVVPTRVSQRGTPSNAHTSAGDPDSEDEGAGVGLGLAGNGGKLGGVITPC